MSSWWCQHHGRAAFPRDRYCPTQAGAKPQKVRRRGLVHHDRIGVLIFDAMRDAHLFKEFGSTVAGNSAAPDRGCGQSSTGSGRAIAVHAELPAGHSRFAARQADQPFRLGRTLGGRLHHAVLINRLAGHADDAFAQLELGALRCTGKEVNRRFRPASSVSHYRLASPRALPFAAARRRERCRSRFAPRWQRVIGGRPAIRPTRRVSARLPAHRRCRWADSGSYARPMG